MSNKFISKYFLLFPVFLLFFTVFISETVAQSQKLFSGISEDLITKSEKRYIIPSKYNVLKLNNDFLKEFLNKVPDETEDWENIAEPIIIDFPLPDGTTQRFSVVESSIMESGLANKYPEIRTFRGKGVDDKSAVIRFGITALGFHSMAITSTGSWSIDKYSLNDKEHYISYYKKDLTNNLKDFCDADLLEINSEKIKEIHQSLSKQKIVLSGNELRTYRLACATTGEYTAFFGGTVSDGLSAVVAALNRVNLIFENEVSLRMILIDNNDQIIYTDGNTDPYTNEESITLLFENQANLDSIIGDSNYDVGHLFSTGGRGVAGVGSPCVTGYKAFGNSGSQTPIGDPFYIDYVCHEFGHQFGASHTFNGMEGRCGDSTRNEGTAFEPGSGSTIMGYAGTCESDNLQGNSDPYLHGISLEEIIIYTTINNGSLCPTVIQTGNTAPNADVADLTFTIPVNTPFKLTGAATDSDGDELTYVWEEFDLGPQARVNEPVGNAPIFRSFPPNQSPTRIFPQLTDIINNAESIGELLPTYARDLSFRFIVRDNHPGSGGIDMDSIRIHVTDEAGPFKVTNPDTDLTWFGNTINTIRWNVANTTGTAVNAANVNILLSTDGGENFDVVIASNIQNDGEEDVVIPNLPTTTARIKVEASDNIFFDISDSEFTIEFNTVGIDDAGLHPKEFYLSQNHPNPFNPVTKITYALPVASEVTLIVYDILGNEVQVLVNEMQPSGFYEVTFNSLNSNMSYLTSGVYFYTLKAGQFSSTKKLLLLK
jgi:hypothetical protein